MRLTVRGRRVVAGLAALTLLGGSVLARSLLEGPQAPATAAVAAQPVPPVPRPAWARAVAAPIPDPLTIASGPTAGSAAERATRTLLRRAPIVVLTPEPDPDSEVLALRLATRLRAPVLAVPSARGGGTVAGSQRAEPASRTTADLLRDLGTRVVVAVGDARVPHGGFDVRRVPVPADLGAIRDLIEQARRGRGAGSTGVVVLVRPDDRLGALAASAAVAAGHDVVELMGDDPRGDTAAQTRLAETAPDRTVLVGGPSAWAELDTERFTWQLAVARRGHQLPGGGQLLFPDRRLVALYGNPEGPALGVLGEQGAEAAVERARQVAVPYAELSDVPVVATFEIIATVASGAPEPAGDWSRRSRRDVLERWVDVAEAAGVYVVLDLQPGTTDLLTQAREFEDLLARPHVGLALDPEWRLAPGQRHLQQIGSISAAEVNAVAEWLAALVREHELPQKLLLVHQFKLSMIRDRVLLRTDHPELAVAIQMDGQGGQGVKLDTWRALTTSDPPAGIWWGWKNFYDEDPTVRPPADVLTLDPSPVFISYQ